MRRLRIDNIPIIILTGAVVISFLHACTTGCCSNPQPNTPLDADAATTDVAPVTDASSSCIGACAKLQELHCPDTRFDACLSACTKSENGNGVVPFNTSCIIASKDLKSVRACNVRCGGE